MVTLEEKTCSDSMASHSFEKRQEKLNDCDVMECVLPGLDLIKEGVFSGMIQFCALLICHL